MRIDRISTSFHKAILSKRNALHCGEWCNRGATVHINSVACSVMIPGGLPHQEIATSDDLELVEVSVPAEMGTKACDPG